MMMTIYVNITEDSNFGEMQSIEKMSVEACFLSY